MRTRLTAGEIIERLGLEPHPGEGGFFRETYRCAETIRSEALPGRYRTRRAHSTAIYYLITSGLVSAMHRLASDEVFHFYLGDPVRMLHLYPDGSGRELLLGPDLDAGMRPQAVVPAGVWQGACLASSAWQGARLAPEGEDSASFALLGTTVAPGFEFEDFELGTRDDLMAAYPGYAEPIRALTSEPPAAAPPAAEA